MLFKIDKESFSILLKTCSTVCNRYCSQKCSFVHQNNNNNKIPSFPLIILPFHFILFFPMKMKLATDLHIMRTCIIIQLNCILTPLLDLYKSNFIRLIVLVSLQIGIFSFSMLIILVLIEAQFQKCFDIFCYVSFYTRF